jgi:hypothetical protein
MQVVPGNGISAGAGRPASPGCRRRGPLDLSVARGSLPEQGPVVDQRTQHVDGELGVEIVAQIAPGNSAVDHPRHRFGSCADNWPCG